MSAVSLYQLAAQYRADFMKLADLDLDDETVMDTLAGMDGEVEAKAANVAMFTRGLDASIAGMEAAAADMAARIKAAKARRERMMDYLKGCMEMAGITKVEAPQIKVAIQQNPPAVDVYDEALVPNAFWRTPEPKPVEPFIDKTALKAALAAGEEIQGARLVRGSRLVLK